MFIHFKRLEEGFTMEEERRSTILKFYRYKGNDYAVDTAEIGRKAKDEHAILCNDSKKDGISVSSSFYA